MLQGTMSKHCTEAFFIYRLVLIYNHANHSTIQVQILLKDSKHHKESVWCGLNP